MNIDVFWSRVNWLQALLQLHLPSYKRCTSIGFHSQGDWVSKNETGNSHPVPSIQVYSRINSIKFPDSGADDWRTQADVTNREGAQRIEHVAAIGAAKALVCLRSSSSHVTEVGGT